MIGWIRRSPVAAAAVAFGLGVIIVIGVWIGVTQANPSSGAPEHAGATSAATPIEAPSAPPPAAPTPPTGTSSASCGKATQKVSTADALTSALASARPGAIISLAPGRYSGNFVATRSGTRSHPITLCGTGSSILDGGQTKKGYVFHLQHANYWHLVGFAVTTGQKGVVTDQTSGALIAGLHVYSIGDEGIHLRDFSSHNTVTRNTVTTTGLLKPKFGEGIYIGTAQSNWCSFSDCKVDHSNYNVVSDNQISRTGAESVDIKEGTSHGILRGNTFDGTGMTGGDSWVDVKGDNWLIEDNTGTNSPNDGFQTHQIVDGQGADNVFSANSATVNGPGYGFSLTPVDGNVVKCSNKARNAGQGLSNVSCSG
jgi:hypothetical protein